MKKLFLFMAVCLSFSAFNASACKTVVPENNVMQQTSDWEKLGEIQVYHGGVFSNKGILYVKTIGEKLFYKLSVDRFGTWIVSLGRFVANDKVFNAKAGDFYFNL